MMRDFNFYPAVLKRLQLMAARDDQDLTLVVTHITNSKARVDQDVLLVVSQTIAQVTKSVSDTLVGILSDSAIGTTTAITKAVSDTIVFSDVLAQNALTAQVSDTLTMTDGVSSSSQSIVVGLCGVPVPSGNPYLNPIYT